MIVPTLARLIVREHLYKPIQGKVLTLGRQTIAMSKEQVIEVLQQEGFEVPNRILEKTAAAYDKKTRVGKGTTFTSDEVFFGLLGIKELFTMDISSYEGADIVHDLNKPIPETLYGQFDFIIDGGTFDHLFDVRTAFENVVKMLKTDGRVFQWNAASNFTGGTYLSFGPDLFYDYYVLNQFVDCKVYVVEVDSTSQGELWDFYEFEGSDWYDYLRSSRMQMVVVLAEKGPSSTWDRMPVQAQYRDEFLWEPYRRGKQLIQKSDRNIMEKRRGLAALLDTHTETRISRIKEAVDTAARRIPDKWKRRIPLKLKNMINTVLQEKEAKETKKTPGFRYVGRI